MNDMTRNYYGQRSNYANVAYREKQIQPMNEYRPVPYPSTTPIAIALVPMQTDTRMFEDTKGLCNGTMFECLNLPFAGIGDCR